MNRFCYVMALINEQMFLDKVGDATARLKDVIWQPFLNPLIAKSGWLT